MARLSIELADDLHTWVERIAEKRGMTSPEIVELLVILESGLRDAAPNGTRLTLRDSTYRQLGLSEIAR